VICKYSGVRCCIKFSEPVTVHNTCVIQGSGREPNRLIIKMSMFVCKTVKHRIYVTRSSASKMSLDTSRMELSIYVQSVEVIRQVYTKLFRILMGQISTECPDERYPK
jgi:hypothetical protein